MAIHALPSRQYRGEWGTGSIPGDPPVSAHSRAKPRAACCANLANSANWRGSESVNSDDTSHRGALSRDVTYGRSDRIRTCDLVNPNHALYQSEPHPVIPISIAQKGNFVKGFGEIFSKIRTADQARQSDKILLLVVLISLLISHSVFVIKTY